MGKKRHIDLWVPEGKGRTRAHHALSTLVLGLLAVWLVVLTVPISASGIPVADPENEDGTYAAILDEVPEPPVADVFVSAAKNSMAVAKAEEARSAHWSALGAYYASTRAETAAAASSARYSALAAFYESVKATDAPASSELAANPELMAFWRFQAASATESDIPALLCCVDTK